MCYMSLSCYYGILSGERIPHYLCTRHTMVEADLSAPLVDLWGYHESRREGTVSLLSLKAEIAERIFSQCNLCERACRVDRQEKAGECGVRRPLIASEFLHWGEEDPLVPSHTVFFSGCNFHCVFCQNHDISQEIGGVAIPEKTMARIVGERGGRNLNLVGGEPTPNLAYILRVLGILEARIPVVWNSNMYMTEETMRILDGVIDVYLTDFKYGNSTCAKKYSGIEDYFEIVTRNHLLAEQQAELIIRHLVMPGHLECCTRPVLKWISENLHSVVNVMFQYRPEYKAHLYPEIDRYLTGEEKREALGYAREFGIELI